MSCLVHERNHQINQLKAEIERLNELLDAYDDEVQAWCATSIKSRERAEAAEALLENCKAGYRTALATTGAAEADKAEVDHD